MSLATQAMLRALQCQRPSVVVDNLQATVGGGQAAVPLRDGAHRFVFVKNPGNSAVLPWLAGHEAMTGQIVVINDAAANAMSVFAWPGDTLNGTLNGSLSIASGACGIFIKVDTGALLDWQGAVIS
jgi:hypothetical protein